MFTGIIEEIGTLKRVERRPGGLSLKVEASKALEGTVLGDSIAINGVCQTVTSLGIGEFSVDVMEESLNKTTLGMFRIGKKVNLERAMTMGKPFGGHIVQGHVQGIGRVISMVKRGDNYFLTVEAPEDLKKYLVSEGSIAIDGLSLTLARVEGSRFTINIIPHTVKETTIGDLKAGDIVNLEPDILIKSFLEKKSEGLTKEKLLSWGY